MKTPKNDLGDMVTMLAQQDTEGIHLHNHDAPTKAHVRQPLWRGILHIDLWVWAGFLWVSCLISQGPLHKILAHSELPSARYAFSILGNALYLPRSVFYFVYKLPFSYVFSTFKTVKIQMFSLRKLLLDVMAMVFEIQAFF